MPASPQQVPARGTTPAMRWAVIALSAALLIVYLREIPTRFLINDDYQNLYTAWLQSLGQLPGRDFGAYSPQIMADLLVPVFRLFPESMVPLYAGRLLVLSLLVTSAWLLMRWTRHQMGALAAWLLVPLVFASRALIFRGLDLRPDPLILLLWMWSLWLMRESIVTRPSRALILGAAVVVMGLVRIKSALLFPLVGLIVAWDVYEAPGDVPARLKAGARCLFWMALGGALGLLVFVAVLGSIPRVEAFAANTQELFRIAAEAIKYPSDVEAQRVLHQSRRVDPLFWIAAPVGLGLRIWRYQRYSRRDNLLVLGVAGLAVGWVVLNPAFYAYNLLVLAFLSVPFAAMTLQEAVALVSSRLGRRLASAAFVFGVLLIGVWAGPVMWLHVSTTSNSHQMGLHRFLLSATPSDASVYAMEGIGLYRPSTFHFRMPAVVKGMYLRGEIDMGAELKSNPPAIVLQSYRVPKWLKEGEDRDFIEKRYVHLAPWLMVPGRHAEAGSLGVRFDAPRSGRYELLLRAPLDGQGKRVKGWSRPGGISCNVDGIRRSHGEIFRLKVGRHEIRPPMQARCTVRRWYSAESRALVANPEERPYLKAPGLSL